MSSKKKKREEGREKRIVLDSFAIYILNSLKLTSTLRARASVICFNSECTHVLLVSSSARPQSWVFPGGGVEPGENPKATGIRELWEEAGALPIPISPTDSTPFSASLSLDPILNKRSSTHPFVTQALFLLDSYPEATQRKREWKSLDQVEGCIEGSAVGGRLWAMAKMTLDINEREVSSPAAILAHLEILKGKARASSSL